MFYIDFDEIMKKSLSHAKLFYILYPRVVRLNGIGLKQGTARSISGTCPVSTGTGPMGFGLCIPDLFKLKTTSSNTPHIISNVSWNWFDWHFT